MKYFMLRSVLPALVLLLHAMGGAQAAPPSNDNFANALFLAETSGSVSGVALAEATRETNEPSNCQTGTVWYKWTAPAAGQFRVTAPGSTQGGISCAYIYVGTDVGSLSTVNGQIYRQTYISLAGSMESAVQVEAGKDYYIQVSAAPGLFPKMSADFSFGFSQPPIKIVASVLPTARSVSVGSPATAYATIINTSSDSLTGCQIALPANVPASFKFGARDSQGAATLDNQTANIEAGAIQNFAYAITPSAPLSSKDVPLIFNCFDTAPATSVSGLNTFLLSASTTPAPDLVSISTTPSNDGIANIQGIAGNGLFVASTLNIGASDTITATVDDNGRSLPIAIALCRTNPSTGVCTNPTTPGPSSTFTLSSNEVGTFSIFVRGMGAVPFDPATSRLFLRFKTPDGVTRGATSVAVRTQ